MSDLFEIPLEEPLLEPEPAIAGDVLPDGDALALAAALPAGFDLPRLLRFLPDIRLKQRLDAAAAAALALEVKEQVGLTRAETARQDLKDQIKYIRECFADPCDLANALHKRLTGLRADFVAAGEKAVTILDRGIVAETKRLEAIADEARRVAQRLADEEVRQATAKAAQEAEAQQAPAPIVAALKAQAHVATAPPVAAIGAPVLGRSAVGPNWKCRPKGTPADAEPNPKMADLSEAQRLQVLELFRAVVDGKAPMVCFELNWSALNARAARERTTLALPGLEAFDAGQVRSKGSRR